MKHSDLNKNKKIQTAFLSVAAAALLILIKLVLGFITNSISIFASAIDSALDLSASSVNYFSIKKAEKPADTEHRFGHGKAEGLAGLFQSSLLVVSSLLLVYVSVRRLIAGASIESLDAGIIVMAFSVALSYFLKERLERVAKETDSIALRADSLNHRADVYTSLGVITGLIVIRFTGLELIDSLVSICVALYIIWSSVFVFRESIDILMDRELSLETVGRVQRIILKHQPKVKSFHKMRTRKSGAKKFIEFHVVIDNSLSFVESHSLAEKIIEDIENNVPNSDVTVHVDPHSVPDYS